MKPARFLLCLPLTLATTAMLMLAFDPRRQSDWLHGIVTDGRGPVAGVRVRVAGQPEFVVTNATGGFALRHPHDSAIVTAGKPGHFIAFAGAKHASSLDLRSLPGKDHADYRWIDPRPGATAFSCGSCHREIFDEWRGSAHGGSSRFAERFAQMGRDYPEGSAVCTSCHDPAPLGERRSSHVHCDFCHKIAGAGTGDLGLTHGKFGLDLLRPERGQLVFGPLDDSPRRENSFSPFQRDSRLCASCHEGTIFGVRVYETYSEWRDSPAGRAGVQCQACHMKPTGRMTNVAPGHGGLERDPATLANHRFFDGDQLAMLRSGLTLSMRVKGNASETQVNIEVRAERVGHRMPTGSPDRSLTLIVEAMDETGKPLRSIRGPNLPAFADEGQRAGRLFAKVLKDWQGKQPVPFWRASPEFEDTRLLPSRTERIDVTFPASAKSIKARLVYRRFWGEAGDVVAESASRP